MSSFPWMTQRKYQNKEIQTWVPSQPYLKACSQGVLLVGGSGHVDAPKCEPFGPDIESGPFKPNSDAKTLNFSSFGGTKIP